MELEQKPTLKVEAPLPPLPEIRNHDTFSDIARKLSLYVSFLFSRLFVDLPHL